VALLSEEEQGGPLGTLLESMARQVDDGETLASAMEQTGRFPTYAVGLTAVGERTGRLEEALDALSRYYESRERQDRQLRNALTYPAVLLLVMLVVIVVLLSQVLPVFNDVYASLGGQLTGLAGGLLVLGRWLDEIMPLLCGLLAVAAALLIAYSVSGGFRAWTQSFWRKRRGDKGISRSMNDAHTAQALAMGLRSGLTPEEALDLAAGLLKDAPASAERCAQCGAQVREGKSLAQALGETGVLPASSCRLLTMGLRGGTGDTVMEDIARRLSDEADLALESKVAMVEPALVLVTSLMVGVILLSVMLPLMHIMTAIG
jgi:type IV pilus assembly protein PilC